MSSLPMTLLYTYTNAVRDPGLLSAPLSVALYSHVYPRTYFNRRTGLVLLFTLSDSRLSTLMQVRGTFCTSHRSF